MAGRGTRVLLVADCDPSVTARAAEWLTQDFAAYVVRANDVATVRAWLDRVRPAVLVSCLHLAGGGLSALSTWQMDSLTGPIATIGLGGLNDRPRALAVGCDDFATKPLRRDVLRAAVGDLLVGG